MSANVNKPRRLQAVRIFNDGMARRAGPDLAVNEYCERSAMVNRVDLAAVSGWQAILFAELKRA